MEKEVKPTQCDLILKYIRDFGSITTWQAMMDLGVARLASRIYDLKQMGYEFYQNKGKYKEPLRKTNSLR